MDWFYSCFNSPKVWSRRVISAAVSNAVAASQAGYAVGLVSSDGNITVREPRLIRIAETLPSEEIDMSSDAGLLRGGATPNTFSTRRVHRLRQRHRTGTRMTRARKAKNPPSGMVRPIDLSNHPPSLLTPAHRQTLSHG